MNRYALRSAALTAALLAAGCSTAKLEATGGSRSDGVVNLSYEYAGTEAPKADMDGAQVTARQRCQGWAFADAQPFSGAKTECLQNDASGVCLRTRATFTYQCTGGVPQPAT